MANKTLLALLVAVSAGSSFVSAKPAVDVTAAAKQIDAILAADWQKNNVKGNPAADDTTFVRRIYLDIIGRIPTTREAEQFLNSKEADKRAKLIDKLIASEGYVQHSFNYWADVLRLTSNGNQTGGVTGAAYMNFVKQSLRENKPYDQFVRDMVAAQGRAWDNGAIGYYMRDRGMPLDNMANTVRVFLGTRIECAQCHNHPFDKWTQKQFYEMASFTYGVQTQDYGSGGTLGGVRDLMQEKEKMVRASFKEPQRPQRTKDMTREQYADLEKKYQEESRAVQKKREEARQAMQKEQRFFQRPLTDLRDVQRYTSVGYAEGRKSSLPHDYKYDDAKPKSAVDAKPMMGHDCECLPGETQLAAYARWMTSKDNPRFTTVIASRLWKRAFGLSLIEPLDELMDATVPMIPELQKHLEKLMVDVGYDMKAFQRVLFNTSAYQRQATRAEVPPGVVYHFTGPLLRRMSAEQMWDSFVALINPSPDMPNITAREQMEQRVLQSKKAADSIDALKPEEVLKGIEAAAKKYQAQASAVEEKQKLIAAARTETQELTDKAKKLTGDERAKVEAAAAAAKDKAKSLSRDLNSLYSEARQSVVTGVVIPGQKKLYEKVTGKPFQVAMLKTGDKAEGAPAYAGGDMMMMAAANPKERVLIPGYDKQELTKEERQALEDKRRETFKDEAEYFGVPEQEMKNYYRSREEQSRNWLRAAEVESPAPRGHYLREFGQSDRETIENANNEASVPQALALMNGQLLPQIIGKYSQLMLTVNKAPYPDDKIDAAYMTLLSRKPTAKEKEIWLKAQGENFNTMEDLIFSLLNTQQFIFIQ